MRMDERKFLILQAIIDDYISTAVPVGSRTISRKEGVGFSPATIRNEMSDLEALGYLDQPHTSAGRVPSAKAYRLYVDHLLKVGDLNPEDAERINAHFQRRADQVEELMRRAARVLSDMTHYTAIIAAPQAQALTIRRVQFVPLNDNTALLIIVTNAGIIKDAVVRIPDDIEPDHLYNLSTLLTEQLNGLTLGEIRGRFAEIFRDLRENRKLLGNVLDVMETRVTEKEKGSVVVGGTGNMLGYPEYSDVEKARAFLSVLESREKLYPLLMRSGGMEFTIRIGPENDLPELSDCSLITASYRIGDDVQGTMGIIGPTRMDYGRAISVLSYMGKAISNMLSGDN